MGTHPIFESDFDCLTAGFSCVFEFTMGKPKKGAKGKKVSLNDFISESTSVNTVNVDGRAVELPSAPRSSTLEIDVSKLPPRPPYTALVANLAYDVTEEDLAKFFDGIELKDIYIPREGESSDDRRFKGVAYVTVDGSNAVENLAHILAKSDHMLLNRKCKIDVYQERGSQFGRGGDRGGRGMGRDAARDDPFYGRSEKSDDWRRPGGDDRGDRRDDYGSRGGDRYDDRRGGGYDDRRGGYDRYGGDRYGDRSRGGYDDRRGGYDDRRGGYDDRRGGVYDRYDDRRGGYGRDDRGGYGRSAADDDSSWRRAAPEIPERRDIPPVRSERPKLQLEKRTVPKTAEPARPSASSNIFGAAKPIDTSKKEKEIEAKLSKLNPEDTRPYRPKTDTFKMSAEDRAAKAAEDLKKRVELGIDDSRPECDRETEVQVTSRFAALDVDE